MLDRLNGEGGNGDGGTPADIIFLMYILSVQDTLLFDFLACLYAIGGLFAI